MAIAGVAACRPSTAAGPASLSPDSLAIRRDIDYLASERLGGRLTGTAGNDSAAAFIARRYGSLGLKPGAPSYEQHFIARPPAHAGASVSLPTQNVVAILPGRDPLLTGEYVVIGAHFDHLGTSTEDALDPNVHAIRRGADDNASGTAAVMELARIFAAHPARRSIIFVNFSGEEQGTLGSLWFVDHLPVATDSIDAMLNFDMVGRLRDDKLIVYGTATAAEMPTLLDSANTSTPPLKIDGSGDGFGPSDHSSFYGKNIPVLHFFTDLHDDYHRATDTPDKINGAGEAKVVAFAERVAREIADRSQRLTYVRVAAKAPSGPSDRATDVYLGSIPDMASSDVAGMKLTGVRAGSPADAAGMKAGDIIVEFGGKPVKDLYEYSDALYAHKPGDVVKVVVVRDGKRLTLEVTLGKRGS